MSIPQVSGPANIWIARAFPNYDITAAQLRFVGTCEQPPTIQLNPQWEPVMNDIGGSLLPIDYTYQGEDGLVSGTLNKWNEYVYSMLSSHGLAQTNIGGAGVTPYNRGQELWSDIGTLSQLEGITFQLYVQFPYSGKTVFGAKGMPLGYCFWACRLAGHVVSPGTRANRRQVIFHCDRALHESETPGSNFFTLYDHALVYYDTVNPTTGVGTGPNFFPLTPPSIGGSGLIGATS